MDINPKSIEDTLVNRRNQLQEGQKIMYEGKEARVIHVEPMFIIKVEDRVICGALHNRIEFIDR